MIPHYELVQVDAIRPSPTQFNEPEVLTYFRLISTGKAVAEETPLILQPVPLHLATHLILGSVWSANGRFIGNTTEGKISSTYRKLTIGKQAPPLGRLSTILPCTTRPTCLNRAAHDAWYATVQLGAECILIPCFELLRAFCYNGTSIISQFLYSRLPLDTLCFPLCSPTKATNYTAHFCIASASKIYQDAIILADLLFNRSYRIAIDDAHANIALMWHECATQQQEIKAYPKIEFNLGKDVRVNASGTAFTLEGQNFFLVSCLLPSPGWHCCKSVVYHPLLRGIEPLPNIFSAWPINEYQDALSGWEVRDSVKSAAMLPIQLLPTELNLIDHGTRPKDNFYSPRVIRSFPWAKAESSMCKCPTHADATVTEYFWSRPGNLKNNTENILPKNDKFLKLIPPLKDFGCSVKLLELNNPKRQFGVGRSVFPYIDGPEWGTHLPDQRYRPLSILCINLKNSYFYLINIFDTDIFSLSYNLNLTKWSNKECQQYLSLIKRAWFRLEIIDDCTIDYKTLAYNNNGDTELAEIYYNHMDKCIAELSIANELVQNVPTHMLTILQRRVSKDDWIMREKIYRELESRTSK